MKEKDFQKDFKNWVQENLDKVPCAAFELKIVKKTSSNVNRRFSFSQVEDHQVNYLSYAKHGYCYHKIADDAQTMRIKGRYVKIIRSQKPFDCFVLRGTGAYIVVWFYIPHHDREMYWIDVDNFKEIRERYEAAGSKSILQHELREEADFVFPFKAAAKIYKKKKNLKTKLPLFPDGVNKEENKKLKANLVFNM